MKVFLLGNPQSGKTTIGKTLDLPGFRHLHISDFLHQTDCDEEELHSSILKTLKSNPDRFINQYKLHTHDFINDFIVEGLISPKDFVTLFDENKDIVVFLNRIDHSPNTKDYQNISLAIMRDYCFWMSSANLLEKKRWIEFNYKMSENDPSYMKTMGFKNTVYSVKGINAVVAKLRDDILKLKDENHT
jgi:hypothetical protein